MDNFGKIKCFVMANSERKVTISEIEKFTGICRCSVRKLINDHESDDDLNQFIVDGRKQKLDSIPINPFDDEKVSNQKNEENSTVDSIENNDQSNINEGQTVESDNSINSNGEKKCYDVAIVPQTILYTEIRNKSKRFVLDESILDLSFFQFMDLINDILKKGYVPEFYVYETDVLFWDANKNRNILAKQLLKFFAQDNEEKFHTLSSDEKSRKNDFASQLKKNDCTLISGKAENIIYCKLNDVPVEIPKVFLEKIPNPFKGEGIVGMDSCMMGVEKNELENLFEKYESILISDIQAEEITPGHLYNVIAYYGQVKFANKEFFTNKDQLICYFYSQNTVDMFYTLDYGCYLFAKFASLNVVLYTSSPATTSRILKRLTEANLPKGEKNIRQGDEIVFDLMEYHETALLLNDCSNLEIYSVSGIKRTDGKAYSRDFLVMKQNNSMIIMQLTKKKHAVVRYVGTCENVPNAYKNMLK